jgi:hypothetical protein
LNKSGLSVDGTDPYSNGDAAGYAFAVFELTAQDLLGAAAGTPISHALGIGTKCVDPSSGNSNIYPSYSRNSDSHCGDVGVPEPNISYGQMVHLKSSYTIPTDASVYCKAILVTLQQYGAYLTDVGPTGGSAVQFEDPSVYTVQYSGVPNPWYNTIEPAMVSAGEGANAGSGFTTSSCLNYPNTASDWEVVQLNQGGTSSLPPIGTP